jgi:type II secretory pathway pseudopilin PulG
MNIFSDKTKDTSTAGFALFYSVVVVAVISSLGAVLSSLIVREADLSATARQSSEAYYSADAGIECAQYWDLQTDSFPDSNPPPSDNIDCAGQTVTYSGDKYGPDDDQEYTFSLDNNDICTDVTIRKYDDGGRDITEIESIGSDKCGGATRVQRALRTTY